MTTPAPQGPTVPDGAGTIGTPDQPTVNPGHFPVGHPGLRPKKVGKNHPQKFK